MEIAFARASRRAPATCSAAPRVLESESDAPMTGATARAITAMMPTTVTNSITVYPASRIILDFVPTPFQGATQMPGAGVLKTGG